jgi:hypothetical protein
MRALVLAPSCSWLEELSACIEAMLVPMMGQKPLMMHGSAPSDLTVVWPPNPGTSRDPVLWPALDQAPGRLQDWQMS